MKNLEFNTEQFESNLIDGIAVVRFKASAFDIATNPRENQAFYDVFEEVSDSAATYGYVQLNDSEFERFKAFDELVKFFSGDTEFFASSGRYPNYRYEVIAARLKNSIGRFLLGNMDFGKPTVAGFQGAISGEYLGLTLAFDARIATADTTFVFDNYTTGLPANPGVTHLLPRFVGIGHAMKMLQNGTEIDAEEALSIGLIATIVDNNEDLSSHCLGRVKELSGQHPHLARYHRRQMLPSSQEMQAALDSYYSEMAISINKLRA